MGVRANRVWHRLQKTLYWAQSRDSCRLCGAGGHNSVTHWRRCMASMAGRRALFWAVESLESRRLLCTYAHQLVWIDPANPGSAGISASLAHDDGDDDGHD